MKIVTYNVNGIRARLPRLLEYLAEQKPDVVCLQELKCADDNLPVGEIRAAGYEGLWHGQKGFNGVAILCRADTPRSLRAKGLSGNPEDSHSRYIEADIGDLIVASVYAPNGNPLGTPKFTYKLEWIARLRSRAQELLAEKRPVVLAGDWNVIPTEDRDDVFSARAMAHDALMQPESRDALRSIIADGWTDAIRACHPHGPMYTFWDYMAGCWRRDAGFRIDHFLLSSEAKKRLRDAGVDKVYRGREKASDHAPTWIQMEG
jgi:exodeoxyribonuclease-3